MIPNLDAIAAATVAPYWEWIVTAAGVAALLMTIAVWRWWRNGERSGRLTYLAIGLATFVAAEGMWELFTTRTEVPETVVVILFSFLEITMLALGALAQKALDQKKNTKAFRYIRFMFAIAIVSGILAASAGGHPGNVLLRLVAPAVAALLYYLDLTADLEVESEPSTWIWTPRRVGIHFGLIQPGKGDLKVADRARRVQRLVRLAAAEKAGGPGAVKAAKRLDRLALSVDEETVAEAAKQLQRAMSIRTALFGDPDEPLAELAAELAAEMDTEPALVAADVPPVAAVVSQWPERVVSRDNATPATPGPEDVAPDIEVSRVDTSGAGHDTTLPDVDAYPRHDTNRADVPPRNGRRPSRQERVDEAVRLVQLEGMAARAAAQQLGLGDSAGIKAVQRAVKRVNGHEPELTRT